MGKPVWIALLLAAASMSHAQTRGPSAQEAAAFQRFYQQRYGGAAPAPVFSITREGKGPWSVAAFVDGSPKRGLGTLCRLERQVFSFERQWREQAPRQFVWLDAKACRAGAEMAELLQRMPDVDVLPLLAMQAAVLPRARLIMAGNSNCAAYRSMAFRFAAIDVGPSGSGNEEMAGLVYRTTAKPQVTVWMRKRDSSRGPVLDTWNVSCPVSN